MNDFLYCGRVGSYSPPFATHKSAIFFCDKENAMRQSSIVGVA
jgi:hypothetical protein